MKLSDNFYLSEFLLSQTAIRLNIKNEPSPTIIGHLKIVADCLELIRKKLGYPINISSGFRSLALNRVIGGSSTSAHMHGYAVDFTCAKYGTPSDIVKAIKSSGIKYDQLLEEYGAWVHISFAPALRQQTLRVKKVKGRTVYESII